MELIASAFQKAKLRGAIIGGVARNYWETPRLTFDIDFTVEANPAGLEMVIAALADHGFEVLRAQGREQASGPDFVQLYNRDIAQVVELQAAKTPFQEEVLRRAVALDDIGLLVATREDIIVLKILALRPKDRDDLRELASHASIDWDYVHYWCDVWQVTDRLENLRRTLAEDATTL
ncbi:MAG: DUF6036 family nucleotidyltransferase [Chloroflexi bacterium]|jgi:hypothetical protein|nr:DUF6036 family nucleotidyltransferase [Chloroflexota bacterium]NJD63935.1 hypothetical protein [Chloroflexota bacterium]